MTTNLAAIKKIVTHAGQFHADEILAIALLRLTGCGAPIERTYKPTLEDMADQAVMILDVGMEYKPELLNFDHHQDKDLPATNRLLLDFLRQIIGEETADQLADRLFNRVSDVDRGIVTFSDGVFLPEFNMLIRLFNSLLNAFERAFSVATEILTAQVETIEKAILDAKRWDALVKTEGVAYQYEADPILCWKEKARAEGIFMLVCPNLRGGYSVISRDTNDLIIPPVDTQTFRHNSGFMATYPTQADAIDHALRLAAITV
ncbi:MAG: MYG1 family protein [Spirosoma sp.]|nr:MYG1 family protein [Spirosoma sp.]